MIRDDSQPQLEYKANTPPSTTWNNVTSSPKHFHIGKYLGTYLVSSNIIYVEEICFMILNTFMHDTILIIILFAEQQTEPNVREKRPLARSYSGVGSNIHQSSAQRTPARLLLHSFNVGKPGIIH